MKYLDKSFSTPANSKAYVDNWEAVFVEKPKQEDKPEQSESAPSLPPPE